jgi:hypothetical protein
VRENQRCNSGAVAEIAKKGGPTVVARAASSHGTGLPSVGGTCAVRSSGKNSAARASTAAWIAA